MPKLAILLGFTFFFVALVMGALLILDGHPITVTKLRIDTVRVAVTPEPEANVQKPKIELPPRFAGDTILYIRANGYYRVVHFNRPLEWSFDRPDNADDKREDWLTIWAGDYLVFGGFVPLDGLTISHTRQCPPWSGGSCE